jgi:hypothetical protein
MNATRIEDQGRRIMSADFGARRPKWVGGEISVADAVFLSGLVAASRARNLVEIGVASGWSSAILLHSLQSAGVEDFVVNGVDLMPNFYLDPSHPTGAAVEAMVPQLTDNYRLHTGRLAFEVTPELGRTDFAFIDADHMHPWATLDLISVLPFIATNSWIAMHDINLCRFPRHKHRNRGPFYLFGAWPDARLTSSEAMPMIGAVLLERRPADYLELIFEILATPWEVVVDAPTLALLSSFVTVHFGAEAAERFRECCAAGSIRR